MVNTARKGQRHEYKVRAELEAEGYIVSRWKNNIDIESKKIVQAKANPWMGLNSGFPDFIAIKPSIHTPGLYNIRFIECKLNGYLNKEEKIKKEIYKEVYNIEIEVM